MYKWMYNNVYMCIFSFYIFSIYIYIIVNIIIHNNPFRNFYMLIVYIYTLYDEKVFEFILNIIYNTNFYLLFCVNSTSSISICCRSISTSSISWSWFIIFLN